MPLQAPCITVRKQKAERTIVWANSFGISNEELKIQKNEKFVFVPLNRRPTNRELRILKKEGIDFQISVNAFEERKKPIRSLAEQLEKKFSPDLIKFIPRSLDIIGDIAIIEIPPQLANQKQVVGQALLETHKKVKTVLAKAGGIGGTYRLRKFELVAGENRTRTIHKEHGCRYYVDVAKAYFSPRLSYEHSRVASLIAKKEKVLDLFAGIGPFSVLIAKRNEDVKVCAVDINPIAIKFLKKNIRLNKVEKRVSPILGDARQIIEDKLLGAADRIVMNLPEKAIEFVDVACKAIKPEGGIIHYYGFTREPESIEEQKNRVSEVVEKMGRKVSQFPFGKAVRPTAPHQWQIVIDVKIC